MLQEFLQLSEIRETVEFLNTEATLKHLLQLLFKLLVQRPWGLLGKQRPWGLLGKQRSGAYKTPRQAASEIAFSLLGACQASSVLAAC